MPPTGGIRDRIGNESVAAASVACDWYHFPATCKHSLPIDTRRECAEVATSDPLSGASLDADEATGKIARQLPIVPEKGRWYARSPLETCDAEGVPSAP